MPQPDVVFSSIADLAPQLAAGDLSPVDVTQAVLARIEEHDGLLNAYITVMADSAMHAARAAESAILAGNYLGPLHGIPIAVKDLYATRGVRTTFGSPLFADWVPDYDATVVERLKQAGAVIVGKANLHELAFGTTSANPHHGVVRNPWDPQCHPGGSSGGSAAAVAGGLAYGALGSDTGASIRQPAACCGIVGLKPTYGRVSKYGALPLSWSMDHAGPMTRTVADAALMMQALAGHDPRDPGCVSHPTPDYAAQLHQNLRNARIGVARDFFFDECDPEVSQAVEAALEVFRDLGAIVEDVELPDMRAARAAGVTIMFSEAAAYHADDLRQRAEAFSDEVRDQLEMGRFYTAVQYVQAQRMRRVLTDQTIQAVSPYDAVVMPTSPIPATPITASVPAHVSLRPRNTLPFNFVSLPAMSVPCGFANSGMPIGLQVVGKPFDEAGVLRVGYAYEQATEWHTRRPTA